MGKIHFDLNLEKKLLNFKKKKLNLDATLFSGEITHLDKEKVLTLYYLGRKDEMPLNEMERVYDFICENKLDKKIHVSSAEDDFPNISLRGYINANIYG